MKKSLKEIRISSGLEIGDIAGKTCINTRYLKAIEEGDFSHFPAEVYARGYIREYAKYLGVSFPEAMREYEMYLKNKRTGNNNSSGHKTRGKTLLRLLHSIFLHKG